MRKEVEIWLKQALKDFESAKKNLKIREYYLVAFLCQQAVEKGLKALFIHLHKKLPEKIHSLIYLGRKVKIPKKFESFLKELTPEFVISRYPNAAYGAPYEMYDEKIAKGILIKTEKVMKWIKSQIEK